MIWYRLFQSNNTPFPSSESSIRPISIELLRIKCNYMRQEYTKKESVQACIWHELVYQHPFLPLSAATKKPDEIPMLKLGNEHNLIFELFSTLHRCLGKPLDCYLLPISKFSLSIKFRISNSQLLPQITHPLPPSLTSALAYATHEQFCLHSCSH